MTIRRFNVPPGWPIPQGWDPPAGWTPDPSWPPVPEGWQFWTTDDQPNWPVPPGRVPDHDWIPEPSWPPAPRQWKFWAGREECGGEPYLGATAMGLFLAVLGCYVVAEVLDVYLYRWIGFLVAFSAAAIIVACVEVWVRKRRSSEELRDTRLVGCTALTFLLAMTLVELIDAYLPRWQASAIVLAMAIGVFATTLLLRRRRRH